MVIGSHGQIFMVRLISGQNLLNFRNLKKKRKTWSHQHDSKHRYYYRLFSYSMQLACHVINPVFSRNICDTDPDLV